MTTAATFDEHRFGEGNTYTPRWTIAEDYQAMSRAAASLIEADVQCKPDALICLATGESPRLTYELLAQRGRSAPVRFSRVRWIKLDEWLGLSSDDVSSCEAFLWRHLLGPLEVPCSRYFGWNGKAVGPQDECKRVSHWLAEHGPVDLMVLGLGINGHLGLNEPGPTLTSGAHIARLSAEARAHPMLKTHTGDVQYGLTLGIGDIMASRKVLLLVSGAEKAHLLRQFVTSHPSPGFPASYLHGHPALTICCDRAAAAFLPSGTSGVQTGLTPDERDPILKTCAARAI